MEPNIFRYIWRHSRREQIAILLLILASLPFYWLSLDIPKRIVNEALQGKAFQGGNTTVRLFDYQINLPDFLGGFHFNLSNGWDFDRYGHLMALSFMFLFFVVCNGIFKLVINLSKGILAERMLRRLRFELFARLMRFQPEDIRAVKPAEAASMINNEVEPIGGFIGDAFIQPAFLGTQALTAMLFIVTQSFWLGMVALVVVFGQAVLIPYLRREQVRLGRERQIAARKLAGRIGEMVDNAALVHTHGLQRYGLADIGDRLGNLFNIRTKLYKRKFAVKFLNNFLAQITPFFFYAIGGYLALRGTLDLGQLIAAIAAYRDLPPPIKELIDWDQARADASVKYEQVVLQFSGHDLVRTDDAPQALLSGSQPIVVTDLRVDDYRGSPILTDFSATIEPGTQVALVGSSSSGRDILARVIGRQISRYDGSARIGSTDLRTASDLEVSAVLSYVPPEPLLISSTIRNNVALSILRHLPEQGETSQLRWREAQRSGNPLVSIDGDWHDYAVAGVDGPKSLDQRIVACLALADMKADLYAFGLQSQIKADEEEGLHSRLIEARHEIRKRLAERNMSSLVEPFDFKRFNSQMSLGGNIVFGIVAGAQVTDGNLAKDPYFRRIIAAEGLETPLIEIGLNITETLIEVFQDLPADHPLLERFSLIKASEIEEFTRIAKLAREPNAALRLPSSDCNRLITLALSYVEPSHRLGLVNDRLIERIMRARASFRHYLPESYAREIEFYDTDALMTGAPLRDNLLYGRVAHTISNAEELVANLLHETLIALDLEEFVYERGLDFEVGPAGRNLFAPQRAAINIARALLTRPGILVVEGSLTAFSSADADRILERIRSTIADNTLIMTFARADKLRDFDMVVTFEGAHGRITRNKSESRTTPHSTVRLESTTHSRGAGDPIGDMSGS